MSEKKHTLSELKKNIKENAISNLYLFWGEERFLMDMYKEKLSSIISDGGLPEFNRMVVEDETTPLAEIMDFIETYPMMSERKLLIISDTGILKSATEEVKEFWQKQLSDLPEHIVIIFLEKEIDKRSVIYKAIDKSGFCLEFEYLKEADAVTWVERQFLNSKKKIKKQNAEYLVSICDEGLASLKNETDKLISFCDEEITRTDIDKIVAKSLNIKVFEMTDAIMEKKAEKALEILYDMKTISESAFKILYILFGAFDKMLRANLMIEEGEGVDVIASKLKLPPFIAKKYIKKNFEKEFLTDSIIKIAEIDYAIKEGKVDEWTALEEYVTNLFRLK